MQSIEYFACARSIFSSLDIWTPRYFGAKYWILYTCKKYLSKLDIWAPRYISANYWILCTCMKYFFEVEYMDPHVSRCKVMNTLHVQEVFFSKSDIWTPRYLGANYWILCTCKKYFLEVGYMDPHVSRCKVMNTLHVQEVFFKVGYKDAQVFRCKVLNTLHMQEVFFLSWIDGHPSI